MAGGETGVLVLVGGEDVGGDVGVEVAVGGTEVAVAVGVFTVGVAVGGNWVEVAVAGGKVALGVVVGTATVGEGSTEPLVAVGGAVLVAGSPVVSAVGDAFALATAVGSAVPAVGVGDSCTGVIFGSKATMTAAALAASGVANRSRSSCMISAIMRSRSMGANEISTPGP